jgi:hypothetical protein
MKVVQASFHANNNKLLTILRLKVEVTTIFNFWARINPTTDLRFLRRRVCQSLKQDKKTGVESNVLK